VAGLSPVRIGHVEVMGIGTSLFLIAVGAILKFAVTAHVQGIALATVGTILMVVGVIGLLISLFLLASWRDRETTVPRDRVVERDRPV
jgi:hypothetical protein